METKRIELENGNYVVAFTEMKHKTSQALQKLLRNSVPAEKFAEIQKEPDLSKRMALIQSLPVEGDDVIILLNQIESWSFGPVTQDIIDNMSEHNYQEVITEVNKLYSQIPLA